MTIRTAYACAACVALAFSTTIPAFAQQPILNTAPDDSLALQEVIVTAQKRTEDLQSVPISVQVVDRQSLLEQNRNSLEDLAQTTPGVHIAAGQGFSSELFIRGVGSGSSPSFDQSVALFSDDIFYGRSRISGATFLDLERIEVLKGPQSTFFGNNAIAGALNIITRKPGNTFEADGRALYGQFGQYVVDAAMGGPLTDMFSARLALTRNGTHDGWVENVNTGENVPRINNEAARLSLDFHPNEAFTAALKIEGSVNKTGGSPGVLPRQLVNCPPPAPITPDFIGTGACAILLSQTLPVGLNNNLTTGLPGTGSSLSTSGDVLTLTYNLAGHTLTSVTGFYNYHYDSRIDFLTPTNVISTDEAPEKYHQLSQEFRVTSPTGARFDYMAGAYFQTDDLSFKLDTSLALFDSLPDLIGVPILDNYQPMAVEALFRNQEKVYSGFGSFGWHATERLKLTAGLRVSSVQKDFTHSLHYGYSDALYGGYLSFPPGLEGIWSFVEGPPGAVALERHDHALMPSFDAEFELADEVRAYASYRRGFKSGGFNGTGPLNNGNLGFDPEHVNAYEVGLKSKWLQDRMLLDVAVFRSDYQDLQVNANVFQPSTNTYQLEVTNAAASVAQGIELESRFAVSKGLQVGAYVTYLDSHYKDFPTASAATLQSFCAQRNAAGTIPQCNAQFPNPVSAQQDLSGQRTDFAPRWSGLVAITSTTTFAGGYELIGEFTPYFSSAAYLGGGNADPLSLGGGYVRLDGRLTVQRSDRHWSVDLIGKNLSDHVIRVGDAKEMPRSVAVQVRAEL